LSLRRISEELAAAGFRNQRGESFHSQSILNVIEGPQPQISKTT
jgi:hypothetical protein